MIAAWLLSFGPLIVPVLFVLFCLLVILAQWLFDRKSYWLKATGWLIVIFLAVQVATLFV